MKTIVALVLLVACSAAYGQNFPLNKVIPDKAIVCLTKESAVAIANSVEQANGEIILVQLMRAGSCFAIEGMMVYTAKVHETKKHFYVYQMTFGKLTGFVPTNMKSDGTDI